MRLTAVRECSTRLGRGGATVERRVVHGHVRELVSVSRGTVCLFSPGELVVYVVRERRRYCGLVFRTLARSEQGEQVVLCIQPRVRLLMTIPTARCVERVTALLRQLEGQLGRTHVSDRLVLQAAGAIAGRAPVSLIAQSLMRE
jgi:hypothetical protein